MKRLAAVLGVSVVTLAVAGVTGAKPKPACDLTVVYSHLGSNDTGDVLAIVAVGAATLSGPACPADGRTIAFREAAASSATKNSGAYRAEWDIDNDGFDAGDAIFRGRMSGARCTGEYDAPNYRCATSAANGPRGSKLALAHVAEISNTGGGTLNLVALTTVGVIEFQNGDDALT